MVKIDLITGFLGSGKTTFIKEYASYFISQKKSIGILENDFGAVNVDMMALKELEGEYCELEMVAGGCDADCHKRRFKTKLISMGMLGYDRILVEPSGIFDVDEFFDVLREEPLDRWYEIGSVIAVVDSGLEENLSVEEEGILASEVANAGVVIFSKSDLYDDDRKKMTLEHLNQSLRQVKCKRQFAYDEVMKKSEGSYRDMDFEKILSAGYELHDYEKVYFDSTEVFQTVYIMDKKLTKEQVEKGTKTLMDATLSDMRVFRIKGFFKEDQWYEFNATKETTTIKKITDGQDVIIVIGENISEEKVLTSFQL
ncbi:MAG: GTPase (G3E family) [Lachnospiraceae bacterium]|nr:GTPase (G3E family) [Lachnospiraceae bacterium]